MEVDARRRKLQFRAAHRGILELDLFIGAFANSNLAAMTKGDMDQFEALLDIPDNTMLDWVMGRSSPPIDAQSPVLKSLLSYNYPAHRDS